MALTQEELNRLQCHNPDCTEEHGPLVLHSQCHTDEPTWTEYDQKTGTARVFCSVCEEIVAEFLVAKTQTH